MGVGVLVMVGVGDGVGVLVLVGDGDGVGVAVGVDDGVCVEDGEGIRVVVGLGVGVIVAVGVWVGVRVELAILVTTYGITPSTTATESPPHKPMIATIIATCAASDSLPNHALNFCE